MSTKLAGAAEVIGESLDNIRRRVFKPEFRERMRLTFIARDPSNPESDIFLSEDDIDQVAELLIRSSKREAQP